MELSAQIKKMRGQAVVPDPSVTLAPCWAERVGNNSLCVADLSFNPTRKKSSVSHSCHRSGLVAALALQ